MESLPVIDRVYKNNPSRPFVVSFRNSFEPLLPGCIPDLHFDFDAIDVNGFDFEVDSNGSDVGYFVLLVGVPEEDVRLAHGRVANDYNLDQIVIFFLFPSLCHFCRFIIFKLTIMIFRTIVEINKNISFTK